MSRSLIARKVTKQSMVKVAIVGNKGVGKSFLVRSLTNDSETNEISVKLPSGDERVITFAESSDGQLPSDCDLALVCCDGSSSNSLLAWEKKLKSANQNVLTWSVFTKADQFESQDQPKQFDFVVGSGNEKQKTELMEALTSFTVEEPTPEMFKEMLGKIGYSEKQEITPKFEIRSGRWLRHLLLMFARSKRFVSVIRFLEELCNFSIGNACAFSQAGVDLLLLKMLQFKKEIGIAEEAIMSLYMRIVNVAATQESVQSFLSLFAPESTNSLYRTFLFYMACLNDLIKAEQSRPAAWITLKSESIHVRGIQGSRLRKGFTVTAWLHVDDRETEDINVFSIVDAKNYSVSCQVNCNGLSIQSRQVKKKVDLPIVCGKWFFLAVSCGSSSVTVFVNGHQVEIEDLGLQMLDKGELNLTLGNSSQDAGFVDKTLLGPVGVYFLLDQDEVMSIARAGPREILEEPTSLVSVSVENRDGTLVSQSESVSINAGIHYNRTFAQVFVEKVKIVGLTPLFSVLDARYVDGEQVPSFIMPLISVLAGLLLVTEDGQREFVEMNGLDILAHLLANASCSNLTYGVYLRWVSVFKLVTCPAMKEALFDRIITRPEIWVHAEEDAQRQISRHWCRDLLKKYPELWTKYTSFQQILSILRIYYWYDCDAEPAIIYKGRAKNIPVRDIRQSYLKILGDLARNHGLDESDFTALIAYIVSCKDVSQVQEMVKFLELLTYSDPCPWYNVEGSWDNFLAVHSLIDNGNESVVSDVVSLFCLLHHLGFLKFPKFHHHIDILMDIIGKHIYSAEFFTKILTLSTKYTPLLPFCFEMMLHGKYVSNTVLKSNLKPDPKFSESKFWTVLPTLVGLKDGGEILEVVMNFIAGSQMANWEPILADIHVIGTVCNVPYTTAYAESLFLRDLVGFVIDRDHDGQFDILHSLLDVVVFHMFYRPKGTVNRYLMAEWLKSDFNTAPSKSLEEEKIDEDIDRNTFYQNVRRDANKTTEYVFGLNIDENGNWIDYELAMKMLTIAKRNKVETCQNMAVLILAIAVHIDKEKAMQEIQQLMDRNVLKQPYLDYLKQIQDMNSSDARTLSGKKINSAAAKNSFELFVNAEQQMELVKKMSAEIMDCKRRLACFRDKSENQKRRLGEDLAENLREALHRKSVMILGDLERQHRLEKRIWSHFFDTYTSPSGPWASYTDVKVLAREQRSRVYGHLECPTKWVRGNRAIKQKEMNKKKLINHSVTLPVVGKNFEKIRDFSVALGNASEDNADAPDIPFSEQTKLELLATVIAPEGQYPCHLLLFQDSIVLQYEDSQRVKVFNASKIESLRVRHILHHPTGIEIRTTKQKLYLVQLTTHSAPSVLQLIASLPEFKDVEVQTQASSVFFSSLPFKNSWVKGEIGNFEYLLLLNRFSERSFDALEMYPVFPWVVKEFTTPSLNLTNPNVFRNLNEPVTGSQANSPNDLGYSSKASVTAFLRQKNPFALLRPPKDLEFTSVAAAFNENPGYELTPEFFACPEYFRDIELPKWAKENCHEFVYAHRKALESRHVTERLHQWIDLVFGSRQNDGNYDKRMFEKVWTEATMRNVRERLDIEGFKAKRGQIPIALFNTAHPKKTFTEKEPAIPEPFDYAINKAPSHCRLENATRGSFSILSVDKKNGTVSRISASFDDDKCVLKDLGVSTNGSIYAMSEKHVFAVKEDGRLMIVDHTSEPRPTVIASDVIGHLGRTTSIAASGNYVVTGGTDSSLRIYNDGVLERVIPTLHDSVECVAVSHHFSAVACGCRDGCVLIYELTNGQKIREINLRGLVAKRVLISEAWGFVLVYAARENGTGCFDIYSINGDFIRRRPVSFRVSCWTVFQSNDGFDYVIVADKQGKVYLFEAFYLDISAPVYESSAEVTSLFYLLGARCILAITDGAALVIPAPFAKSS